MERGLSSPIEIFAYVTNQNPCSKAASEAKLRTDNFVSFLVFFFIVLYNP